MCAPGGSGGQQAAMPAGVPSGARNYIKNTDGSSSYQVPDMNAIAVRQASSRGTGGVGQSMKWKTITVAAPKAAVKSVVAPKPTAPVKPGIKPTNKPVGGTGEGTATRPNRLFPDRGGGVYGNVAQWGENYYRTKVGDNNDVIAKFGGSDYVGSLGSA